MKKKLKKVLKSSLSIILAFTIIFSSAYVGFGKLDFNVLFGFNPFKDLVVKTKAASSGTCGSKLTWELNDEGILTISGTGAMKDYSIDSPEWYSLSESINTIVIENGVTTIGVYAFSDCINLTSVTIPNSVTSIGDCAFRCCDSLESISIPDSVTSIGEQVFEFCSSLVSIGIPDSLTSIGVSAFLNTGYYDSSENWENNVLYIGNHLIAANNKLTGNYSIKFGTKTIANSAFSLCERLISVTIPNSVTSIGNYAFRSCRSLTSISIPDRVTYIGERAFFSCENLSSITIPESVTSINNSTFENCSSLKSVEFSDSLTSIGSSAFSGCTSLTSIIIPDNVTTLDSYCFAFCGNLTSVILPAVLKSIGLSAFSNCNNLKYVFYKGSESDWGNVKIKTGNSLLTNSSIHYNTTEHNFVNGYCSFCGKEDIFTYIIENNCVTITGYTGTDDNVIIPDTINGFPVTCIGEQAFFWCSTFTSVTIPDSVTTIEYGAFLGTRITSLTIPDNVTRIGGSAFSSCENLTTVIIPSSVTSIGSDAFSSCNNLKYIFYTGSESAWSNITIADFGNWVFETEPIHYNTTEHSYSDILLMKNPTCIADGIKYYECSICNYANVVETIPNFGGHVWENNICTVCDMSKFDLVESEHPYENNTNKSWTIYKEGAYRIAITFSEDTETDSGWDEIFIYDSEGDMVGRYSGTELAGKRIVVSGDTVCIKLVTNEFDSNYGFKVVNVEVFYPKDCPHSKTEIRNSCEPDCINEGYTGDTCCTECGTIVFKGNVIDPTGDHEYASGFCVICHSQNPSHVVPVLSVGENKTASIRTTGNYCYFYFTPKISGVYSFASASDKDTLGYIFDEAFNVLKYDDDGGAKSNFKATCYLEAGKKYIFGCRYYSSYYTGSFDVTCNYDFYTVGETKIIGSHMFIPNLKTLISDFITVSDNLMYDYTASSRLSETNYFGTGSEFYYYDDYDNKYNYTIIVEGDLNGDSVVDVLDCAAVEIYANGHDDYTTIEAFAANGCTNEEIDVISYQATVNKALAS